MSTGHHHEAAPGIGRIAVDNVVNDQELRQLAHRFRNVDRTYDLPYLGGYSVDGSTMYIDRHVPDRVEHKDKEGKTYSFRPEQYLLTHEGWEKALIDGRGWNYAPAHRVAEAIEDREALMNGLPPKEKEAAFKPYIKATEHERIERVPADLDLTPYLAAPVNKRLLAHMQKLMGGEKRSMKQDVDYTDHGSPAEHCGPTYEWMQGQCRNYIEPHQCKKVFGYISPRGWCKLWVAARAKEKVR